MKVEITDTIDYIEYEKFVNNCKITTFFQSKNHILFLKNLLDEKPNFIIAKENDELIGILPFFEKESKYGRVVNSLPFFGSYGGIITEQENVMENILKKFNSYNEEKNVLSSVIITSPFTKNFSIYEKYFKHNTVEKRLTQCTLLNNSKESLLEKFEKRVRWSIRKSEKNDIKVKIVNEDLDHMKEFYQFHKNTMETKNGKSKPSNLFSCLVENFEAGKDYDIFTAIKDKKSIAYLLIFYYKKYAEYYMPAYDPDFLNLQGTSLLIWESMKKSLEKNCLYYNFGGTWENQKDLYRFKRGWNAEDLHYQYYIFRDLKRIRKIGLNGIQENFPNFYVCPYNEITD